ncbi:hypothetical protein [Roseivirga thermotolerans]|uniref:hypothetical protein n=1 Tax=Roseivirga thermotolerans TaxID=1758176 RepID=UPI00273D1FD5|nr:hypothetical protein [Roseivirga thermotolerans]
MKHQLNISDERLYRSLGKIYLNRTPDPEDPPTDPVDPEPDGEDSNNPSGPGSGS